MRLLPFSSDTPHWFEQHVRPHEAALRRFLRSRFPGVPDHDDIVQETFVAALRDRELLKSPKAFLFVSARNRAITATRRRQRSPIVDLGREEAYAVAGDSVSVEERLAREQEVAALWEAIDALPPRCREIFVLNKFEGRRHREIAERCGISVSTVQLQVHLAKRKCTESLMRWRNRAPVRLAG